MAVLEHLKVGFVTAAELAALLFVSPAFGGELVSADAGTSRIEILVRDDRAYLTAARRIRNDGAVMLDLARKMPEVDDTLESLRVLRGTHVVDLIADGDCSIAGESSHVRLATDEAVADALSLAPGESAWIEVGASRALQRDGSTQLALPWLDALPAQALLVADGDRVLLIIVAHAGARGAATAHVRPAAGPAQQFDLGTVEGQTLFVVPLGRHADLGALAAGAIEFEIGGANGTLWATLPLRIAEPGSQVLAVDIAR